MIRLGETVRLKPEFDRRGVTVSVLSADPPGTGRNFNEIVRAIDSLQLMDRAKVASPVNWRPGERETIATSISGAQAKALFPQGWEARKPFCAMLR